MDKKDRPYILHLETATDICSIAISYGESVIAIKEDQGLRNHAEVITLFVEEALELADMDIGRLDAVSLSEGPGSYTSLRVGMSVAKGICYGIEIPLVAVNTLEAIAFAASKMTTGQEYICAMIDARRMEVYASLYDRNMEMLIDNEALILEEQSFDNYLKEDRSVVLCGNGAAKGNDLFDGLNIDIFPFKNSAKYLVEPALKKYFNKNFENIAYFSPNYIKSPNITQARKKLL